MSYAMCNGGKGDSPGQGKTSRSWRRRRIVLDDGTGQKGTFRQREQHGHEHQCVAACYMFRDKWCHG